MLEEKKHQIRNQPTNNLKNRGEDMEMNISTNNAQPVVQNILARLNNVVYNKSILEVYHIAFLTFAIAVTLVGVVVKRNLRNNVSNVEEYSHTILCFLDLTPRILFSIILPMTIYVWNPEMQTYIRGLFRIERHQ